MRTCGRAPAQAIVEFALVITMFTTLMLGVFDWARVLATYISMANATREASRQAEVISNSTTHLVYASCSGIASPCTDMQAVVSGASGAVASYTLQLGPGQFVEKVVCLFDPGTVLTASAIATCTAATNNGPEAPGSDAAVVVRATYKVQFMPLMSAIVPNGLTFSTSTVTYLE
jgi:Flp pilus assembly protein TadG